MAKDGSVLKSKAYPIFSAKMSNQQIRNKYRQCVGRFIEKRNKELSDIAPYYRIYFGSEDIEDFTKSLGINLNQIDSIIKETYYSKIANFNPRAAKDPFTISMMMIIKYFYDSSKKDKKLIRELELSVVYLSFSGSFYPSIHYGSFPKVQPSEYTHVMDYVVNNLLSNKFDLKREGSVLGAIRSINRTWLDSYEDLFNSFDDEDIVYLIQQLHNRIKSFMKNIAELYYDTYDNKDHVFTYDSDNLDEDNYHLADNDSLKIERAVENAMSYVNSHSVDYTICKRTADSNVKADEVKNIIELILNDNENIPEIKELFRCIITDFYQNNKNVDIRDLRFLSYTMITKPNTKEPLILRQKEIINSWLIKYSTRYARTTRPATQSSYFKSILGYFATLISRANK